MAVVRRNGLAIDNGYTNPYGVGADRTVASGITAPQKSTFAIDDYGKPQANGADLMNAIRQNYSQNIVPANVNVTGVTTKVNNPAQTGVSNVSYHDFSPNATTTGNRNNTSIFDVVRDASKGLYDLTNKAKEINENINTTNTGGGYGGAPSQSMDYMSQLSAMLQAQQAQQQAQLAANQQAHQALVEQAYRNNLDSLNAALNGVQFGLGNTLNGTLGQLEENYNYAQNKLNENADNALREAYINRMLSQKNLQQQLNAQGLTGGAAESAVAGLINNYGNARNNIETQRISDLAGLLNTYQNNANSARQQYNSAMNDLAQQNYGYQRQLQNDLANGVIGTYDALYNALNSGANTYANAMQNLASSQVNNAADLAAQNYRNLLNAMYKGTSTGTKASGNTGTANAGNDSSIQASVAQRYAAGEDPGVLWDDLMLGGMTLSEAKKYLESLGVKF